MHPKLEGKFEYRIDPEVQLGYCRVVGVADGRFIAECARTLQRDAAWSSGFDVIWDERGIEMLDLTPNGLDEMVEAQASGQHGRDVVITDRDDHKVVMKLYAWRVRERGRPASVFATLEAALEHLGFEELPESVRMEE